VSSLTYQQQKATKMLQTQLDVSNNKVLKKAGYVN